MSKLEKVLRSRGFWTAVLMFLLGGLQAISGLLPSEVFVLFEAVLLAIVGYFKVNPSQKY